MSRLHSRLMSLLYRLGSLVASADSLKAGIEKAKAVATQVKQKVENYEIASFQECLHKAERNDASAQYEIGEDYYLGQGAPQDYAEALRWFLKAADRGHVQAQANAGMLYALGRGVPQDRIEALKWITLAVARGNKSALKVQQSLLRKMPPDQVAEAKARADEWTAQRMDVNFPTTTTDQTNWRKPARPKSS